MENIIGTISVIIIFIVVVNILKHLPSAINDKEGKYLFRNRYYYKDKDGWWIYDNGEKISVIPPDEIDEKYYIEENYNGNDKRNIT